MSTSQRLKTHTANDAVQWEDIWQFQVGLFEPFVSYDFFQQRRALNERMAVILSDASPSSEKLVVEPLATACAWRETRVDLKQQSIIRREPTMSFWLMTPLSLSNDLRVYLSKSFLAAYTTSLGMLDWIRPHGAERSSTAPVLIGEISAENEPILQKACSYITVKKRLLRHRPVLWYGTSFLAGLAIESVEPLTIKGILTQLQVPHSISKNVLPLLDTSRLRAINIVTGIIVQHISQGLPVERVDIEALIDRDAGQWTEVVFALRVNLSSDEANRKWDDILNEVSHTASTQTDKEVATSLREKIGIHFRWI